MLQYLNWELACYLMMVAQHRLLTSIGPWSALGSSVMDWRCCSFSIGIIAPYFAGCCHSKLSNFSAYLDWNQLRRIFLILFASFRNWVGLWSLQWSVGLIDYDTVACFEVIGPLICWPVHHLCDLTRCRFAQPQNWFSSSQFLFGSSSG